MLQLSLVLVIGTAFAEPEVKQRSVFRSMSGTGEPNQRCNQHSECKHLYQCLGGWCQTAGK